MMAKVCEVCGYVYDESVSGPFEDQHEDWYCPNCGSDKDCFVDEEIEDQE